MGGLSGPEAPGGSDGIDVNRPYWHDNYVMLDDGSVRRAANETEAHGAWDTNRRVGYTKVGGNTISTAFIVVDHRFGRSWPPLLFETMALSGPGEGDCERTSTRAEAEAAHKAMCRKHGGAWYALYERERERAARG